MRLFGIAGWSGSGKTTLLVRLIAALEAGGITVASVKRTHHRIEIDAPEDDSRRLRQAGAFEVLVAGRRRWALIHELRDEPEPRLDTMLARFGAVDLVLVEGFKRNPHDKLEVHRPALGKPLLCRDDPHVVALASDVAVEGLAIPVFDLDQIDAIAAFIRAHTGLGGG